MVRFGLAFSQTRACACALRTPRLVCAFDGSHANTGWVLGYGTEGHLAGMPGNWTWKIESLYMDLGHLDTTSVTSASSVKLGGIGGGAGYNQKPISRRVLCAARDTSFPL